MTILDFQNVTYNAPPIKPSPNSLSGKHPQAPLPQLQTILEDVTFDVLQGDFITIIGSSGSGKSTLLRLCCHLISPSQGKIFFSGKDMASLDPILLRRKIAYCHQTPILFGRTVRDNLVFPYEIRKLPIDTQHIFSIFSDLQLTQNYLEKEHQNLSGGEKQRIALIRAVLFPPDILLLDEVTSALDDENTHYVEKFIMNLNTKGCTILWITHDQKQSIKFANRRLQIKMGKIFSQEVLR